MLNKLPSNTEAGYEPAAADQLDVALAPQGILGFRLVCIGVLVLAGGLVAIARVGFGERNRITGLLDLDAELSIATYFSSLMLLAAGCLLGLIALAHARRGRGWHLQWSLLALGFVWLAFDEAAHSGDAR